MIKVKNFSFSYEDSNHPALENINLNFNEGETILLVGPNGSGKSTLLKGLLGVIPKYTGGKTEGQILYKNTSVLDSSVVKLAGEIGFLLQDPKDQVTNLTVEEEMVFGLENLKKSPDEIRKQSTKFLGLMNLEKLRNKSILLLSAGQLQKLSLASLIAMEPQVLIMDEPLTSLDPNSVNIVIETLSIIKRYVKLIIISTHWVDPFLKFSDRLIFMTDGKILLDKKITDIFNSPINFEDYGVQSPQIVALYERLKKQGIKVNKTLNTENLLDENYKIKFQELTEKLLNHSDQVIKADNISFSYANNEHALRNITLELFSNSTTTFVGANGSGKSTFAKIVAGLRKPTEGEINTEESVGFMFQNPSLIFMETSVLGEIKYNLQITDAQALKFLRKFDLYEFRKRSPFTLSEGEKRRLALAIAMVKNPKVLILDEPTAGIDEKHVKMFKKILNDYKGCLIQITHDSRIVGKSNYVIGFRDGTIWFKKRPCEIRSEILLELGYQSINPSIKLGLKYLEKGFPFVPEDVYVIK